MDSADQSTTRTTPMQTTDNHGVYCRLIANSLRSSRAIVVALVLIHLHVGGIRGIEAPSFAQEETPPQPPSLEETDRESSFIDSVLLRRLDAGSIDTRQEATEELLRSSKITEEQIYHTLLAHPDLSPEQFDRLMRVAERRRLEQPGVIGIYIDQRREPPGVGVDRVMREAPAHEVLQAGDVIHVINGHLIDGLTRSDAGNALRFAVAASKAGDPVHMVIERRGRRLEVHTRLADPREIPEFRGNPLMANRREQWSIIERAIMRDGRALSLLSPDGRVVEGLDGTYASSLESITSEDPVIDQRASWQIDREFDTRLERLRYLEQETLALAQVAEGTPSLREALVERVKRLRQQISVTLEQYQEFRSSLRESQSAGDTSS